MTMTDPIQTILALLKGVAGLGTASYPVKKDDDSTDCSILITYALAKETLASLFGGSQDYDVIVTLAEGSGSTEWIGVSTELHRIPIVLTINTIEKHSGVTTKVLTPELIRWRARDSLLKLIDANVQPGGSILTWITVSHRPEEDFTVRPILYKYIIETEAKLIR